MLRAEFTGQFKKDYKLALKRRLDIALQNPIRIMPLLIQEITKI